MKQCPVDICTDIYKLETSNWFSTKLVLQVCRKPATIYTGVSVLTTIGQATFLQVTFVQVALIILTKHGMQV